MGSVSLGPRTSRRKRAVLSRELCMPWLCPGGRGIGRCGWTALLHTPVWLTGNRESLTASEEVG